MSIPKDLVAASATPVILSILSQGDSYGYAIIEEVRRASGGEMQWGRRETVFHLDREISKWCSTLASEGRNGNSEVPALP